MQQAKDHHAIEVEGILVLGVSQVLEQKLHELAVRFANFAPCWGRECFCHRYESNVAFRTTVIMGKV